MAIIRNAALENGEALTEFEAKKVLEFYNLPVFKAFVARDENEAVAIVSQIGYPVVLKVLSRQIIHKTEAGGVILDIKNEDEVRAAFRTIMSKKVLEMEGIVAGVDEDLCSRCRICKFLCPYGAIEMMEKRQNHRTRD